MRGVFLGVFVIASIPHAGVVLLSLAERWYGTVIPDELTMRHYIEALGNGLVVPSIRNSLMYAGTATVLAVIIGLGVAWVVVRSDLKIRGWLDALVMMPLAVPGLVMAFGYLALSQEGNPLRFSWGRAGVRFSCWCWHIASGGCRMWCGLRWRACNRATPHWRRPRNRSARHLCG